MVPENAFPAFKPAAPAGKVAAIRETNTVLLRNHWKSSKWWISMKSIGNPADPGNWWNCLEFAAAFPASAARLNAGNAFSGTIKRFCTEEILHNSIFMNQFWDFWSRKSWKSRILVEIDQNLSKSTQILDFQEFPDKKLKICSSKFNCVKFP